MTSANAIPTEADVARSPESRNLALALRRGLAGRCPHCGKGAMFSSYLKVNPRCPDCGEDLSSQRADDAPAYLTLLIVCHVVGAGVLLTDASALPVFVSALLWLCVTAILSLAILPRMKGAVVAFQWALIAEGFSGQWN